MSLALVVEGDTDLPIARKLAHDAGLDIYVEIDSRGKGQIDTQLRSYNRAAKGSPWFVLRDLDHDATCASSFLKRIRFQPSSWMCFRLAIRELESWLLADELGAASFFGLDRRELPQNPDEESDPTATLVRLSKKSRKRRIREAMTPPVGFVTTVGPLYEATIIEFGAGPWSLDRASGRSQSLHRARRAMRELGSRWNAAFEGRGSNT